MVEEKQFTLGKFFFGPFAHVAFSEAFRKSLLSRSPANRILKAILANQGLSLCIAVFPESTAHGCRKP
jgi:hypothetical protein